MTRLTTLLIFSLVAAGCATGKEPGKTAKADKPAVTPHGAVQTDAAKEDHKAEQPAPEADETQPRPKVTYQVQSDTTLGEFLPDFADAVGGSLVIMNGLEQAPVKATTWKNAPYDQVVAQLAKPAKLFVEENPFYSFVYAKGYETLTALNLEGKLDPAYADVKASVGFGYATPLFKAFALLGGSSGVTIVADQIVGDAGTGSLNLAMSPLHACLTALLKSARVPENAFEIENNAEYIFIHAKSNAPRATLLNADALTPAQNGVLDRKVTVAVPTSPLDVERVGKLGAALPVLSRQLGVEVTAEPGLDGLPVAPAYFKDARVRTVMDLLIRAWPVPEFGYIVEPSGDTIRITIKRVKK